MYDLRFFEFVESVDVVFKDTEEMVVVAVGGRRRERGECAREGCGGGGERIDYDILPEGFRSDVKELDGEENLARVFVQVYRGDMGATGVGSFWGGEDICGPFPVNVLPCLPFAKGQAVNKGLTRIESLKPVAKQVVRETSRVETVEVSGGGGVIDEVED